MAVSSQIIATLAAGGGGKILAQEVGFGYRSTLGEAGKRYLVVDNAGGMRVQAGPVTVSGGSPFSTFVLIELAN